MLAIRPPLAKRRRLPLTPLIDVIFILVMFFLLASTFGVWRPLDVLLGQPGAETQPANPRVPAILLSVSAAGDAQAMRIEVNGNEVLAENLVQELDRLFELGAQDALLLPSERTSFQAIVRVLDLARTSRLERISLKVD